MYFTFLNDVFRFTIWTINTVYCVVFNPCPDGISQSTGALHCSPLMTLAFDDLSITYAKLECASHRQRRSDLQPSVTFKEGVLLTQEILLH